MNSEMEKDVDMPRTLLELLEQTQLENFLAPLRDDLQITQISHLDFVQSKDLVTIFYDMDLT